jgi:nucleoside-diphosphate-sugar epimerase
MARILISGGAGYVGSHCAKALAAAGHEGIVFDSLLGPLQSWRQM